VIAMIKEVLIGGAGGQGVMIAGQLLASAAVKDNKNSSCLPAYGPEMRGGTANCTVILSPEQIITPLCDFPASVIVLNEPSYQKFKNVVHENGLLIYNSSLFEPKDLPGHCNVLAVPCNDLAAEAGSAQAVNMVALGAYLNNTEAVSFEALYQTMEELMAKRKHLIPINQKAVEKGAEIAKKAAAQ